MKAGSVTTGLLRLLAVTAALALGAAGTATDVAPVNVTLYAEALCPYCASFLAETLAPLLDNGFDNVIDFRYVAWGNARRDEDGAVACQHGPAECGLDRVISCATHLQPDRAVWLSFLLCLEAAPATDREAAVDGCAARAGIDAANLHSCAEGEQGRALEAEAEAATADLRPPHRYVPWVVVNGVPLGEDADKLWRYVCIAYSGKRPEACYAPPAAVSTSGRSRAELRASVGGRERLPMAQL
ncbi:hypothetical protein D9Q98_000248 [Chlorella vulgaris]|uniref:Gamma-interferon-inducible lysosomal thiol reductase n=1 Tax=Chlorella vulgaris TaxID=3077 RepID=A0A9D4Z204_CHLVU|nr:hypothetical protein D9Q98_000248 [Chlorella vulgaris]